MLLLTSDLRTKFTYVPDCRMIAPSIAVFAVYQRPPGSVVSSWFSKHTTEQRCIAFLECAHDEGAFDARACKPGQDWLFRQVHSVLDEHASKFPCPARSRRDNVQLQ